MQPCLFHRITDSFGVRKTKAKIRPALLIMLTSCLNGQWKAMEDFSPESVKIRFVQRREGIEGRENGGCLSDPSDPSDLS